MSAVETQSRQRLAWEVGIVLALSFGLSALYSIVSIIDRLTREVRLSQQTSALNQPLSDRQWLDLTYQLLSVFADLAPVALVCWLAWSSTRPHLGALGVDFSRAGRDSLRGVALVAIIGIPGLGLYFAGRALDLTTTVVPAPLDQYWWTVPVLLLSAARAGISEELIVVGYLFDRLRRLGWSTWTIIVSTSLLRGGYHLYQGIGAFVGNVAMGLLFGWLYSRWGRVVPFLVAHILIDALVFVGYPVVAGAFPALFGLPE
ncbi:CPBP family intramembrane glutamic endopeptidase [Herbiconiux sp. SYSU D00978]|uniref:CPBP family intramembrane glutamic endopeptidase n=1 Tax=Herbiconiux sp. SYSU D00978 TaxID=2812562 RepID=UPI0027DB5CE7|nr:CPBP family intramembrane glutamic endopeptidase [Herbiconiux sp. SYSU D00978]